MKKNTVIILAVVAIIAVGAFVLLSTGKKGNDSKAGPLSGPGTQVNRQEKGGSFVGTLRDAIAQGTAMKCESTVETEEGSASVAGVIQGKNYAGQINVNGEMLNVLVKDDCMWNWKEGEMNGLKTCFDTTEVEEEESGLWGVNSEQLDTSVSCMPTVITADLFSPPANISFLDMDELYGGELTEEQKEQLKEMSDQ